MYARAGKVCSVRPASGYLILLSGYFCKGLSECLPLQLSLTFTLMTAQNDDTFMDMPGKLAPKTDPRDLNLANYLKISTSEDVPLSHDWTVKKTSAWGVPAGKKLENCPVFAAGQLIESWDANLDKEQVEHTEAALQAFTALTGYDPATGENNKPLHLADIVNYWGQHGIGRHRIEIYLTIPLTDHNLVKAAISIFGGIYAGFFLPESVSTQTDWELVSGADDTASSTNAGHALAVLAYDSDSLTCIFQGKAQKMTWEFYDAYCDEAFALVTTEFLKSAETPMGINLPAMKSDRMTILMTERPAARSERPVPRNESAEKRREGFASRSEKSESYSERLTPRGERSGSRNESSDSDSPFPRRESAEPKVSSKIHTRNYGAVPREGDQDPAADAPARAPRTFARTAAQDSTREGVEYKESVPEAAPEPAPEPRIPGRQVLNEATVARLNALAAASVRAEADAINDAAILAGAEQAPAEEQPVKSGAARNDLGESAPTKRVRIGANRTQTGSSKDGKDPDSAPKRWAK